MTLADCYRDLARAVERIEGLDIDVRDASLDRSADEPVADLRIAVPERAMTETPTGSMYPAEAADQPEPDEETEPSDQDDQEDDAADVEHGPAKLVCDVDGCDYESDSERGLNIHQTKGHTDENEELWCGRCGAGPFETTSQLSGHHAGAGHDGDLQILEHPPADAQDSEDHEIGEELDELPTDEASADGGAVQAAPDFPDVDPAAIHDAIDKHAPKAALGAIAEELDIGWDRARTVVYKLDRYDEVLETAAYTGGDPA